MGSAALELCAIAAGTADAYVEEGLHLWDRAAAALVATEAGAMVEVHRGRRRHGLRGRGARGERSPRCSRWSPSAVSSPPRDPGQR